MASGDGMAYASFSDFEGYGGLPVMHGGMKLIPALTGQPPPIVMKCVICWPYPQG